MLINDLAHFQTLLILLKKFPLSGGRAATFPGYIPYSCSRQQSTVRATVQSGLRINQSASKDAAPARRITRTHIGAGESAGDCRAVSDMTVTDVWGARYGISLRLFSLVAEQSLERYFNPKWTAEKSWLVTNNVIRWIKELLCCLMVKYIKIV